MTRTRQFANALAHLAADTVLAPVFTGLERDLVALKAGIDRAERTQSPDPDNGGRK